MGTIVQSLRNWWKFSLRRWSQRLARSSRLARPATSARYLGLTESPASVRKVEMPLRTNPNINLRPSHAGTWAILFPTYANRARTHTWTTGTNKKLENSQWGSKCFVTPTQGWLCVPYWWRHWGYLPQMSCQQIHLFAHLHRYQACNDEGG